MKNKIIQLIGVLVLTFIMLPTPKVIAADNIEIQSVTGNWQNPVGSPEPVFTQNLTGVGTNNLQWGIAAETKKSGYVFVGNAPPAISNIPLDTPFALGTFTHNNFIIYATGGSLNSVDLAVSMTLTVNGQQQVLNSVYTFLHNETPNVAKPISSPINNDFVSFVNNTSSEQIINIDGVNYKLTLIGFSTSPGSPLVQQFSTQEVKSNSAELFAQFSRVEVPEPSTYMLLGAMLFTVALAKQRQRQKALV